MKNWAILELYCGESGKIGYYNSQEIGLARALVKRGKRVLIVYPDKGAEKESMEELEEGIRILKMPCKTIGVHSFYSLDFLVREKIEVVHLDSDNQMYAPRVLTFCKKHGILCYNYVGTVYSDSKNPAKRFLMNRISARNMRYFRKTPIAAKTEAVKAQLEESGVRHAELIPVGLDLSVIKTEDRGQEELRRALGFPEDKKVLLFVGRLARYKRPFSALHMVKQLGKDYCLVMIGSGNLWEDIGQKIEELQLTEQVIRLERVPNVQMYQYYAACDYFVNFNSHEIFGMSVLEAMYQECVVVARCAPGPNSIVEDGISGYLCETDEEMMTVIESRVDEVVKKRAKQRILESFTWDKSAAAFDELIEGKR